MRSSLPLPTANGNTERCTRTDLVQRARRADGQGRGQGPEGVGPRPGPTNPARVDVKATGPGVAFHEEVGHPEIARHVAVGASIGDPEVDEPEIDLAHVRTPAPTKEPSGVDGTSRDQEEETQGAHRISVSGPAVLP